jgi:16S rRNA (guanine527-N7)-methyltransferase
VELPVDNHRETLAAGLKQLGQDSALADRLWAYAELLLKWNKQVNLTAITDPVEVVDKHLLDSLAVLPEVPAGPCTVLDLGAGAGLPGIPWALARADLQVTLVDAVQKKVAFIKTAAANLGLAPRVRGVHLRVEGDAEGEGLGRFDLVVSRAFMDVDRWVPLAARYLKPGGVVLAMVGQAPSQEQLEVATRAASLSVTASRRFQLPISGDPRGVLVFRAP